MKKSFKLLPALLALPFLMGAYFPNTSSYDGLEILSDTVSPSEREGYEKHNIEVKNVKDGYALGTYVSLTVEDATYYSIDETISYNFAIVPNETKSLCFILPENTTSYTLTSEAYHNPVDMNVRGISDLVKEGTGYYGSYYSFTFESDINNRHYYEAVIIFGDNTNTYNNIIYLSDAVDGRIRVQVTSPAPLNEEEAEVKNIILFEGEGDRGQERINTISYAVISILTSMFFLIFIYGGIALTVMVIVQTATSKKKKDKQVK